MELPKIETGIPIAKGPYKGSGKADLARKMNSGDSFEVSNADGIRWRSILWNHEFRGKFVGRKQENGNVRFWKK